MEWLNAYIRSANRSLEQTPEVFDPVRMDVALDILLSVIDYVVHVVLVEIVVRP